MTGTPQASPTSDIHAHTDSDHAHSPHAVACESGLPHVEAPEEAIARTAEVFKALATPSRLRILLILSHGPSTVTGIVDHTHLSQPLVSQHLKLMRGLGLVSVLRQGREAIYSLQDDHVAHMVVDALAHVTEH
ncbi:ArsR/SmtB family transcription factor [Brevibacterium litoralis]|uniref:ArsR/SmtB family transcription factor n=1 Tax=Brevibacterium litoralis TaxID=3138935 RepID=UPI0032EB0600